MKLLHQINLAFGLLLVVVLSITGVLIHFVLMDHFMMSEKEQLRTIGNSMASTLTTQAKSDNGGNAGTFVKTGTSGVAGMAAVSGGERIKDGAQLSVHQSNAVLPGLSFVKAIKELDSQSVKATEPSVTAGAVTLNPTNLSVAVSGNVEAYLSDAQGHVLQQNIVVQSVSPHAMASLSPADASAAMRLKDIPLTGKTSGYIVSVNAVPQGTLTLMTPISKIKAIEWALFGRLLIVLGIGGALALLFSLLITRKLIHPLMKLREELKKVRERQFAEVGLVKAGGEIGAVAQTVYELAGELERYNSAQKHFFQNASHELKTPLMSIAGYAEGIRDGVFVGESSRKGLDIILSESGRLTKIVTEMTLLAKLDSEENIFQPSAVGIREIVTETIERINPLLAAKNLELRTVYREGAGAPETSVTQATSVIQATTATQATPVTQAISGAQATSATQAMPATQAISGVAEALSKQQPQAQFQDKRLVVTADRDKLLQALLNVVSNAARYAERTIVIEIGIENGQIVLAVADDGKGFPENLLPHLFHRFVKGKDGETGLGLAISRAIVERCGGRISAGNRERGGAVISLRFPRAMPG